MAAEPRVDTFEAIGTTGVVVTTDPAARATALDMVLDEVGALDVACSRFRPDSELSRLNASPGRWVPIGPVLSAALRVALDAAAATDGAVDPTLGRPLRLLGYDRDLQLLDPDGPPVRLDAGHVPGWPLVELDAGRGRARVPSGVEVDLGATAKAWCADRAAAAAASTVGGGVLVALGGDVAVAGAAPAEGWAVVVSDDHAAPRPEDPVVVIRDGGLATSSTTVRHWRRGGRRLHHLLDPRTGAPVDGPWRTVSVAARTAAEANTASTAAIVLGHAAPDWLTARSLPGRLVGHDGGVVTVGGWPDAEAPEPASTRSAPAGVAGP